MHEVAAAIHAARIAHANGEPMPAAFVQAAPVPTERYVRQPVAVQAKQAVQSTATKAHEQAPVEAPVSAPRPPRKIRRSLSGRSNFPLATRVRAIVPPLWQDDFLEFIATGAASDAFTAFLSRHGPSWRLWQRLLREETRAAHKAA